MNARRLPLGWTGFALVLAAVAWLHVFVLQKLAVADDVFFSAALDQRGLLDYLHFRYQNWTGRIPIEAALVLLINHMPLWRLLNAAMLLWLCHSLGRIGFGNRVGAPAATAIAFALLMLLPPRVLWEGAWWVTGSFNYLWPVALGAYACLPWIDGRERSGRRLAVHAIAGGLAAYNEQVGFILLGVLLPLLARPGLARGRRLHEGAAVGFIALNWLVTLTAPGVGNRYLLEHRWFPNYDTLDAVDKASIGLGLIRQAVLDPNNLLVLLLALLVLCALPALRDRTSHFGRAALRAGLAWILLTFLAASLAAKALVFHVDRISAELAALPKAYLAMALSLTAIASLVVASALATHKTGAKALHAGWALLVGLAAIAALGWSPTAYASGERTFFAADVVFVGVACRVLAESKAPGGRSIGLAVLAAGCVAGYRFARLAGWA